MLARSGPLGADFPSYCGEMAPGTCIRDLRSRPTLLLSFAPYSCNQLLNRYHIFVTLSYASLRAILSPGLQTSPVAYWVSLMTVPGPSARELVPPYGIPGRRSRFSRGYNVPDRGGARTRKGDDGSLEPTSGLLRDVADELRPAPRPSSWELADSDIGSLRVILPPWIRT
jgi:hypothetical protein